MAVVATLNKDYGLDYMWHQTGDTEWANMHLPAKRAPGRRYARTRRYFACRHRDAVVTVTLRIDKDRSGSEPGLGRHSDAATRHHCFRGSRLQLGSGCRQISSAAMQRQ